MFTVGTLVMTDDTIRLNVGDAYHAPGMIVQRENRYGAMARHILWQDGQIEPLIDYRTSEGTKEYCLKLI